MTGGFFFFYFLYRTLPPLRGPPSLDRDGFNWKNFNHIKSLPLLRGATHLTLLYPVGATNGRPQSISAQNKTGEQCSPLLALYQALISERRRNNKKKTTISSRLIGSGSVLTSRAVASQVLSALKSLTSVFGMRTGGTSSPLPPLLYYSDSKSVVTFFNK